MFRLASRLVALAVVVMAAGFVLLHAMPVRAQSVTFAVNTTADTPDANPGDGVCADTTGLCSLRAAVMEANALPDRQTVRIDTATPITITLSSPLTVSGDLEVQASGVSL